MQRSQVAKLVSDFSKQHQVAVFSKTWCPFCAKVKALFESHNVKYEAYELRDKQNNLYNGYGVRKAVENVNVEIFNTFTGRNPLEQKSIDYDLIELDNTKNKSRLGANAMLGFSMAVARASANFKGLPLWHYIGGIRANTLPVPMMNIINGGAHANNGLDFQECMIMPIGLV